MTAVSQDWQTRTFAQFYRWGFYFRIRGWGLAIQRDLPILFSERYGYRSLLRIGRWAFTPLRRSEGGMMQISESVRRDRADANVGRLDP